MDENFLNHKDEEPSPSSEEQKFLDNFPFQEADISQLPQELVSEPAKDLSQDQRQNLYQRVLKMNIPQKVNLAMLGNQDARNFLIHDPNKIIPLAVLRSPKVSENEVLNYAQQKNVPEDVLLAIARHKTWIKNYLIKFAVVSNPKTPLSVAIKFLDHLHDKDLQALSRNKNISSILARAAARMLIKRAG